MPTHIKRGEVYWVKLDPTIGTETKKHRPAVILSNNAQNMVGYRFIIAPITSNIAKIFPFDVKINIDGKPSKVMVDQIRTIDKLRLGNKMWELSLGELHEVEAAIRLVLALG